MNRRAEDSDPGGVWPLLQTAGTECAPSGPTDEFPGGTVESLASPLGHVSNRENEVTEHLPGIGNGCSRRWYLVLGVFALAAIVRLWGIQHSLPFSYYTDEAHFVRRALSFGSGDFNPHWFHKPAFYMYTLFVEYGVYYCAGRVFGFWSSTTDLAVSFVRDPYAFYLIGRLTTVAFGLACIGGVYNIGEKHFGKHVGLIAALLLGLTYGHVEAARVVKADVPTACFGVWSMYFLLNYMKGGRAKSLVAACILAGMGAATKYYTVMMIPPIFAAIILLRNAGTASDRPSWTSRLRMISLAIAVFLGACFVCSPYNFLDARGRTETARPLRSVMKCWQQLVTSQSEKTSDTEDTNSQLGFCGGMLDYGRVAMSEQGMGGVIAVPCMIGFVVVVASRLRHGLVFALFPIGFAVASAGSYPGYASARHQCPFYAFLAVAGGVFVVSVANRLGSRAWLVYSALALALCHPGFEIGRRAVDLSREDTRNAAKAWIEESVPAGTKILVDENGPQLLASETRLDVLSENAAGLDPKGQFTAHYPAYLEYQRLAAAQGISYDLYEIRFPWWRKRSDPEGLAVLDSEYDRDMGNPARLVGVESYDFYVENGFRYAVVHSGCFARFFRERTALAETHPAFSEFYHELFARGKLIREFPAAGENLAGPVVRVYEFTGRDSRR